MYNSSQVDHYGADCAAQSGARQDMVIKMVLNKCEQTPTQHTATECAYHGCTVTKIYFLN